MAFCVRLVLARRFDSRIFKLSESCPRTTPYKAQPEPRARKQNPRFSTLARLDRLGPAREVIQIGSVLGGDFSYELLDAVHPIAEPDLQRALRSLTDAELLYVRGIAPEATCQFKHALIRDAAYEALLKSRRKELHRLVAGAIDRRFPRSPRESTLAISSDHIFRSLLQIMEAGCCPVANLRLRASLGKPKSESEA
jgi:hypothetical protein